MPGRDQKNAIWGLDTRRDGLDAKQARPDGEPLQCKGWPGTVSQQVPKTMLPAAVGGEAAALVAVRTAHQRGAGEQASRRTGEAADLTATSLVFAAAGAPAGPVGVVAGPLAGAAMWVGGSATAAAATRVARRVATRG